VLAALLLGCAAGPRAEPGSALAEVRIEGAPVRGAPAARVTIVEFADFRCPYCARMQPVLARVLAAYPHDVRLVFVHFPVVSPDSSRAAIAAAAAGRQGRFWEMHDFLFGLGGRPLEEEVLVARAAELGLDVERFSADLRSPDLVAAVESDLAEAKRLGLRGTPAFFVNGVYLPGTRDFETFRRLIEDELARPPGEPL
jgi:protein-disulfide isomerase